MAYEMAGSYESLKENFVKDLGGTSMIEITAIVTSAPICCLLYFVICCSFPSRIINSNKLTVFLHETVCLTLPNLLILTLLEGYVTLFNFFQLALCSVLGYTVICNRLKLRCATHRREEGTNPFGKRKQFISNFRAFMLVATVIAILAVDFKIFPRRYAKAEYYGTGFMDIGVGSFVFGHAIISQFVKSSVIPLGKQNVQLMLRNALGCVPIFVLGFLRLITVKASGYHKHITEYGIHWNFFFTLASVKLTTCILFHFLPHMIMKQIWRVGVVICSSYQVLLSHFGLKNFVKNGISGDGSRHNLIDANREGITSCAGYIGLFLLASQLGKELHKPRTKFELLGHLVAIDTFLWLITIFSAYYIDPVSRQLANLTYILWIMALNTYLLICFLAVELIEDYLINRVEAKVLYESETILSPRRPLHHQRIQERQAPIMENIKHWRKPLLVEAINRNQLLYFLVGNVLTGIVNITMKTIYVDDATAMIVLLLYMTLTNGTLVLLHLKNINTKFW